ncbi:MAG: hypothetical protein WDW38_000088 [Sanguina aurantia]
MHNFKLGQWGPITCPAPLVINILSATYGRSNNSTCLLPLGSTNNTNNCMVTGPSILNTVTGLCNGNTNCLFSGSAALGFYTIIGSTPVYAVGMYHLPGTDNYLTIATYSPSIPNDHLTYATYIWSPTNPMVSQPINLTSSAACGGGAWLPNDYTLFAVPTNLTNSAQAPPPSVMTIPVDPWFQQDTVTGYYPMAFLLPDEMVVVLYDTYGGIINPMTGQLLAQLPSLGPYIHFESQFSASWAPLMMSYENNYTVAELFIVGGKYVPDPNAAFQTIQTLSASSLSFRINITVLGNGQYTVGAWQIEDSLIPRILADCTLLPNGVVLVTNGYQAGTWGYGNQVLPASLTALYYTPSSPLGSRFSNGPTSTIPRGYHSEAALTTNGTVLITGNDRTPVGFVAEILTPSYVLDPINVHPVISSVASQGVSMSVPYSGALSLNLGSLINVYLANFANGPNATNNIWATLASPSLTTHSRNSGQRLTKLQPIASADSSYVFQVPTVRGIIPAGWYMLFIMNGQVYSKSVWVTITY